MQEDIPARRAFLRYGLIPTLISILLLGGLSVLSCAFAAIPSPFNADTSIVAASLTVDGAALSEWTTTPAMTPANMVNRAGWSRTQLAEVSASAICCPKWSNSSSSQYGMTSNVCPEYLAKVAFRFDSCLAPKTRAASFCSKSAILSCCARLMRSSNTKREIVQKDSTATPEITSQMAMRWTLDGYRGDFKYDPCCYGDSS